VRDAEARLLGVYKEHARDLRSQHRYEDALTVLGRALEWAGRSTLAEIGGQKSTLESLLLETRQDWADHLTAEGQWAEAIRLYEALGQQADVLRVQEIAAGALADSGRWDEAAEMYSALDQRAQVANAYAQGGRFMESAKLYETLQHYAEAGENYKRANDMVMAAESFKKAGNDFAAAEAFERAEHWAQAAGLYDTLMRIPNTADMYARAGMHRRAADLYHGLKEYTKAAELYELATQRDPGIGVRLLAASSYLEIGESEKFRTLMESALEIAKRFQNYEQILNLHNALGKAPEGMRFLLEQALSLRGDHEYFEAREAYWDAAEWIKSYEGFPVDVHNSFIEEIDKGLTAIAQDTAAYLKFTTPMTRLKLAGALTAVPQP
ncbi:MAG: hypothetical protein O3C57_03555, partial [Verrucomicrobia bacterium]|nr:hypothetical protein [Verrucomicrobiota bacterium]